jgi:hypothetical protein
VEQQLAETISRQLGISPEQVVREEHELRKYLPKSQWPVIDQWSS